MRIENTTKGEKIAIFLSILWLAVSFILCALSIRNSSDNFLVFLALFISITAPIWIYWTGFWIWGSGYVITFLNKIKTYKKSRRVIEIKPANKVDENKSGFINKLFKGNISLPKTYWVFSVLIGNIGLQILVNIIDFNYVEILSSEVGKWSVILFYYLATFYSIFISIAVWRSAEKYDGAKHWSVLAQISVILGILALLLNIIQSIKTQDLISSEISSINKSLPIMIDSETRFDSVSIHDRDIYYSYTLVNYSEKEINVMEFTSRIHSILRKNSCSNKKTRALLIDENRNLIHTYYDKTNKIVTSFIIERADCQL